MKWCFHPQNGYFNLSRRAGVDTFDVKEYISDVIYDHPVIMKVKYEQKLIFQDLTLLLPFVPRSKPR